MHHRDARPDLIGLSPTAEDTFLELLTKRDVFHTSPASDHFALINFQLRKEFEISRLPGADHGAHRQTSSGFCQTGPLGPQRRTRPDEPDQDEATLIGHVELEVPSGFSLRNCEPGDDLYFGDPLVIADGNARNTIRFIRVGGQLEVFINERRVLYQPILSDLLLQKIQFQVVGSSIDVSEFTLNELIRACSSVKRAGSNARNPPAGQAGSGRASPSPFAAHFFFAYHLACSCSGAAASRGRPS